MHLPVGMEPLLWQYQVKSQVVITIVKKMKKGKKPCLQINELVYLLSNSYTCIYKRKEKQKLFNSMTWRPMWVATCVVEVHICFEINIRDMKCMGDVSGPDGPEKNSAAIWWSKKLWKVE